MNRSLLIVICDFLLLSLLTFSTDLNHLSDKDNGSQHPGPVAMAETTTVSGQGQDLASVMKLAFQQEQKNYSELQQQLASARAMTAKQQALLAQNQQTNAFWQQRLTVAQTNIETLSQQVQSNAQAVQRSQEEVAAAEAAAAEQANLAAKLRDQIAQLQSRLENSNQLAQAERQQLASQLQLVEVEKQAAADRASLMQQEVQAAHMENTRLTEGLQTLATNSSQLTREIRDNRPLAPNTIFDEFIANRVALSMAANRTGFLGITSNKNRDTEAILVNIGTNIFALCHVQDTPLTFWDPGTDWDSLTGTLAGRSGQVPIHTMVFDQRDPRVVMLPVKPEQARQLGNHPYQISATPYNFQDAVLVGANSGYYGQCNFQIDLNTPDYVKLDRSFLRGLLGEFNPSRGDFVFSRTGQLLGIMVNSSYCLLIRNIDAAATLALSSDVRNEHTGATFAQLYDYLFQLPSQLQ